ncbi:hypothetical protein MKX75_17010 [Paenibacillus sp. FSL R5-0341]|uniref:hypothetical protein n=1 Tax=Paenibacillus sp. FSL R5-0341 TaxID=2921636 RepID=UPI0030CC2C4F
MKKKNDGGKWLRSILSCVSYEGWTPRTVNGSPHLTHDDAINTCGTSIHRKFKALMTRQT